jgi:hypothetical protein
LRRGQGPDRHPGRASPHDARRPRRRHVADYEISEHALAPSFAWAEANDAAMATVLANLAPWQHRSSPERMRLFLDLLRERHGSIEAYLIDAGLEPELFALLRDRLLEP